jgi:hypothetical protein
MSLASSTESGKSRVTITDLAAGIFHALFKLGVAHWPCLPASRIAADSPAVIVWYLPPSVVHLVRPD